MTSNFEQSDSQDRAPNDPSSAEWDSTPPLSEEEAEQSAPESYPEFMPQFKSDLKTEGLCLGGFLLVFVIFRFSAVTQMSSHFLGGYQADAGLYVWLMKSNIRDLFSLPWFNTSAFYPYTQTLAWSDNFILPSLVAAPLVLLGASYAFAYNFVVFLASILNGYCTYRLCHKLTESTLPSFFAGVLFMLAPPLTAQMGHPQLIFAFWLPLGISLFFSFLASPGVLRATLAGLVVTACFLTTVYYSLFLVIIYASLLFMQQVLRPYQFRKNHFFALLGGAFISALPLIPFALPYLSIREMFGSREIYESFYFSATGISYLSFSPLNRLYSWTSGLSHAEAYLGCGLVLVICSMKSFLRVVETKHLKQLSRLFLAFFAIAIIASSTKSFCSAEACVSIREAGYPGYITSAALWISLISLALLFRKMGGLEQRLGVYIMTNRALIAMFLFTAYLFFSISLGPLGNPVKHQWATGPFRLFYELVPGFNSVRAISRSGIVVCLCMCVLFAFSMQLLSSKSKSYKKALYGLFVIAVIEGLFSAYPLEPSQLQSVVFDQVAETVREGEIVAVLPLTSEVKANQTVKHWSNFAKLNVQYLHWLFPSGAKTINGYSGQRSKVMLEYPRKLSGFPDRRSLNALQLIQGVRYIIYSSQFVPNFSSDKLLAQAKIYPELKFLHADPEGNYLFSLERNLELVERYHLRVPSFPQSYLHIELMAGEQENSPEYVVNVHEVDHFGDARVANLKLPADGKWQQYSLLLPQPANKAKPFRLSFRKQGDVNIFMRSSKMSAVGDLH